MVAVTRPLARLTTASACGWWMLGRWGRAPDSWTGNVCPPSGGVVTGGKFSSWSDCVISGTVSGRSGMEKSGRAKSKAAVRSPATDRRQSVMLRARTPVQVSRNWSIEVWL